MTPEELVVYISPFLTELAHTYGESQTAEAERSRQLSRSRLSAKGPAVGVGPRGIDGGAGRQARERGVSA